MISSVECCTDNRRWVRKGEGSWPLPSQNLVKQKTWISLQSTQPYMNSSFNNSWCKHVIKEVYNEGIVTQSNVIISLICIDLLKLNSIRIKYNLKNTKFMRRQKFT